MVIFYYLLPWVFFCICRITFLQINGHNHPFVDLVLRSGQFQCTEQVLGNNQYLYAMLRVSLITFLLLCAYTASFSQSKKKQKPKSDQQQSTSLSPYFPSEDYEPVNKGKSKSKSRKATYNAMDQHEARMKQVVKDHRKAEKELAKPQYSDPTYFGHKRKPKKRNPGKMKFCKECEIRH